MLLSLQRPVPTIFDFYHKDDCDKKYTFYSRLVRKFCIPCLRSLRPISTLIIIVPSVSPSLYTLHSLPNNILACPTPSSSYIPSIWTRLSPKPRNLLFSTRLGPWPPLTLLLWSMRPLRERSESLLGRLAALVLGTTVIHCPLHSNGQRRFTRKSK